jgi:hypothetical protein
LRGCEREGNKDSGDGGQSNVYGCIDMDGRLA